MNKRSIILNATALAFATTASLAADFYVTPNGSDANPGTQTQPFATLERARDAIRALKKAGPLKEPVTVWLGGGTYTLSQEVKFGPEDSGTADCPITYTAAGPAAGRVGWRTTHHRLAEARCTTLGDDRARRDQRRNGGFASFTSTASSASAPARPTTAICAWPAARKARQRPCTITRTARPSSSSPATSARTGRTSPTSRSSSITSGPTRTCPSRAWTRSPTSSPSRTRPARPSRTTSPRMARATSWRMSLKAWTRRANGI